MFPNKSPDYILAHSENYKKYGILRWEDGKDHTLSQDYVDMLGWKELARKTDSVYAPLPSSEPTLILCANYGQTDAINYYAKNKAIVAVSFTADYINWFKLDRSYINLIRIKTLEGQDNEMNETSPFFKKAYVAGTITNSLAREFGTTIFVFRNTKIDIKKKIEE